MSRPDDETPVEATLPRLKKEDIDTADIDLLRLEVKRLQREVNDLRPLVTEGLQFQEQRSTRRKIEISDLRKLVEEVREDLKAETTKRIEGESGIRQEVKNLLERQLKLLEQVDAKRPKRAG